MMQRKWTRSLVLSVVLVVAIPSVLMMPGATAGAKPKRGCPVLGQVVKAGAWTMIKPPPDTYWDGFGWYAVNPSNPEEMYAQPGSRTSVAQIPVIFYSGDGGCHWQERKVPQLERATWVETIIPESDPGAVYLLLADVSYRPVILVSRDKGRSWKELDLSDIDLDVQGGAGATPLSLVVAPGDPKRLYLSLIAERNPTEATGGGGVTADTLYISKDGGDSWQLAYSERLVVRHAAQSSADWRPWGWRDVAVDPLNPDELWMIGRSGKVLLWDLQAVPGGRPYTQLWHSKDAGSSWTMIELGGAYLDRHTSRAFEVRHPIDIFHPPGREARITVRAYTGAGLFWSEDGGSTWTLFPTDERQCQGGHASMGKQGTMICAGGDTTYGQNSGSTWDIFRLDQRVGRLINLHTPIDRKSSSSSLYWLSVDRSRKPTVFAYDHGSQRLLKLTTGGR